MTRSNDPFSKSKGAGLGDKSQAFAASVLTSLPMGVVTFDCQLKIIQSNDLAQKLLVKADYIDRSLAEGADTKVWGSWSDSLKAVISTGRTANFDSVEYSCDAEQRLLRIIIGPLTDSVSQDIIGGLAVIEDITGKDSVNQQLSQTERHAAVGKVAAKVAHELNNPMDGILRYINMSVRAIENKEFEKPKDYLAQCKSGLMRMVRIIGELLEFSRGRYLVVENATVECIVQEAVKSMETKSPGIRVNIESVHDKTDRKFRGDNLFQVFCNLIKNAIDAMQGEGDLDISISRSGDMIAVEFKDTGPGFADEHAESIFEPFFTTKENGRGTGLGLAICKDIIGKYKGRIVACNNPDGGSVFTVYLPAVQTGQTEYND